MSQYYKFITEATGVTDAEILGEIEEIMRYDIFHSTLDWQTKRQLMTAAKEAYEVVKYLRTPEGKTEFDRAYVEED